MASRLVLLLGSFVLLLGQPQRADAQANRLNVVELFTSQGCSSCPPADALLKTYAARPDILALSFSVDYWDYLGWKDTLASPKFTLRQRAYANARGDGEVYTPQIVVNGISHVVGSHATDIEKAIRSSSAKIGPELVPIQATAAGKMMHIDLAARPTSTKADMATVWLAVVQPTVEVAIKHGENRGKKVTYVNVVRELTAVGAWIGDAARIDLPQSALLRPGERCAVLLQAGEGGRILGAAWVQHK